jgi:hypothetical protein
MPEAQAKYSKSFVNNPKLYRYINRDIHMLHQMFRNEKNNCGGSRKLVRYFVLLVYLVRKVKHSYVSFNTILVFKKLF